jgi:polysaccharide biosynthesis transport protein
MSTEAPEITPKAEIKAEPEVREARSRSAVDRPFPTPAPEPPEQQLSFNQIWLIVRKRQWFLFTAICACFALAVIFTLLSTTKYQSTSIIEFNKEHSDALELSDERTSGADSLDYVVAQQTQVNALKSDDLALQVVKQLDLESRPEFRVKPSWTDRFHSSKNEAGLPLEKAPHRRTTALKTFGKNLRVDIVPGTRMIKVEFFSPDAQVAADIVNTLVTDYQDQYRRVRMSATMQVSDWLSKQLDDLKNQVQTSQERLVAYQKKAGILGTDESHNIVMMRLEAVDKQLTEARANRIMAQVVAHLAQTGNPELMSGLVGASGTSLYGSLSLVEQLRSQEAQLKVEYAQAATKFGPAYPKLLQMHNQIEDLDESIKTQVNDLAARAQNDYLTTQRTEAGLRVAFEESKDEANKLNDSAVQYTVLKHEVESSRALYDELQKKLKEAGVLAGLRSTNIVILDAGMAADRPARPITMLNLGIGFLAGLFIGLIGMFVLENMDETVSTPDDVEQITMLPVLGLVPHWKRPKSKRIMPITGMGIRDTKLLVASQPRSQIAEAYRGIRTSIMQVTRRGQCNVLMVTSSLPEEGKTTTSLNCAAAFAQQGSRVLFVEADMRRATISSLLNVTSPVGLSSLIEGETCLTLPIAVPSIPKLSLIPAGSPRTYPAELLGSPEMAELIKKWRTQYDFVVIDTPPVLSVTDAVVLAPLCDAVILVVRSRVTKKQSLRRARSLFLRVRTRVAGVVLNAFDMNSPEYGGYYGIANNSKLGKGYFETEKEARKRMKS